MPATRQSRCAAHERVVGDETAARLVSHSMSSTADALSIDTIVVGVDASETALAAVKETATLARQLGARLHIVSAVGSEQVARGGSGTDSFRSTSLDRAQQTLAEVASRLRDLEVTTAALKGKPADVIVAEAENVDADLIVVGSKRMTGIGRALGSIANDVAHHAPCSVYIAKTTG
jgi:nucleotide-binding universal stress UspA family protein